MVTDMFYGASPQLFENAKKLREAMTPAELQLWEGLRANKLKGFRFKAQHPLSYFIADFYCHAAKLVIELDGDVHNSIDQQEYDLNRTSVLNEFGITVIRFRNEEVMWNLDVVLSKIAEFLSSVN
ncbi:endonuclease domain-containing protein [Spirosoma migulaei]